MRLTTSWLPYWPVHPHDVSNKAWPFVHHLNELHQQSRFFDRVWSRLQWVHPTQIGFIRTDEMEEMHDKGHPNQALMDAFCFARNRKFRDDFFIMETLSDALSFVAPKIFDQRLAMFGKLMAEDNEEWRAPVNGNKTGKIIVTAFLFCVQQAQSVLAKRDLELGKLREGHYLSLWKAEAQKLGAIQGGRRSAETRQANRRADPAKIVSDAKALLTSGKSERQLASIIAARSGVTADHIRKIMRDAKINKTEEGSGRD